MLADIHYALRRVSEAILTASRRGMVRSWPVYALIFFAMIANSLQSSALSLRLATLQYSHLVLGSVMSAAFVGLLFGSRSASFLINRAGARSSVSVGIILLGLSIALLPFTANWPALAMLRWCIGFSLAILYVSVESELNSRATAGTRTLWMSVYMSVVFLGIVMGQPLLLVSDPLATSSFWTAGLVAGCGLAFVFAFPTGLGTILGSDTTAARFHWRGYISFPVLGCFCMGISQGAFFGIGPAFGHDVGMEKEAVALFMLSGTLSGGVMQLPIGWMADRLGRAIVMICCVALAIFASGASIVALDNGWNGTALTALIALWGGATMPVYPVLLAEANDRLDYARMVSTSGRLIAAFGLGAVFGPIAASLMIDNLGQSGFYDLLILASTILLAGALLRFRRRYWRVGICRW